MNNYQDFKDDMGGVLNELAEMLLKKENPNARARAQ